MYNMKRQNISCTEKTVQYSILDPSGNITALVESPLDISEQTHIAGTIMDRHPQVEQVGFVSFPDDPAERPSLRMAGGEFCGNASMCTGALYAYRQEEDKPADSRVLREDSRSSLYLNVSGTARPVEISLKRESPDQFLAGIVMPPINGIRKREFYYADPGDSDASFNDCRALLPIVDMEGISHIIIEESSPFHRFFGDTRKAEEAIRIWCRELAAPGLGLIFLNDISSEERSVRTMTPLVYIPGNDTLFWENSCASGSAAAAYYLADKTGQATALTLSQPGGDLMARSDPQKGETRIQTTVRILSHESLSLQ